MFRSARIKLTAWYLLIIMVISLSFSVAIYRVLGAELDRIQRAQELRTNRPVFIVDNRPPQVIFDPELLIEAKNRIKIILAFINLIILTGSTAAGYFLAGKTLEPIKSMVEEQNRFIGDASHELRTPLTSLKTEIEVNLRDQNLTLKEAKKILKSNLEDVNHLQDLTNKLIKLNHFQYGYELNLQSIPLSSVINISIDKIAALAKVKNIKINNRTEEYSINADLNALSEVVIILLDNAIKYSPENSLITIKTHKTSNWLKLSVSDQGIGISKKNLPHIFDRFYQADNARTKTENSGYGLGLSIAKKIIDTHHGQIDVQSQLDKGTKFIITLPFLS